MMTGRVLCCLPLKMVRKNVSLTVELVCEDEDEGFDQSVLSSFVFYFFNKYFKSINNLTEILLRFRL